MSGAKWNGPFAARVVRGFQVKWCCAGAVPAELLTLSTPLTSNRGGTAEEGTLSPRVHVACVITLAGPLSQLLNPLLLLNWHSNCVEGKQPQRRGIPWGFVAAGGWEGEEALQCAGQDFREVSYLWAAGFTREKSAGIGRSSELLPL